MNTCIGLKNHKLFLVYLVCLLVMLTWGLKDSLSCEEKGGGGGGVQSGGRKIVNGGGRRGVRYTK